MLRNILTYSGLLGDIREDGAQVGEVGGDSLRENISHLIALRQTLRNISINIPQPITWIVSNIYDLP